MNPAYILGTGIYSCLATNIRDLESALSADPLKTATPDAVPLPTKHQLCSLGLPRNIANRASQAEAYAFMAASQAMSSVFVHTNPDTRTLIDPVWNTHHVRLGVIVASDASTLPHAEALSSVPPNLEGPNSPSVSGASAPSPLPSRLALQCMTSSVSSFLAPLVGAHAFAFTVGAACASSHLALHTAYLYLNADLADMILVVGVSETGETAHLAFNALGIDGVHPSGGAAAVLLASEKGCKSLYFSAGDTLTIDSLLHNCSLYSFKRIFPRITGFGLAQSPNRVTPDTTAMITSMTASIRSAYLSPHDIDLILAHHTGSQLGNASEDAAIAELYTGTYRPQVLSTKRLHGHEMWMSGLSQLVEAVAIFDMFDRISKVSIPGLTSPVTNTEADDYVTIDLPPRAILCNSFAFGGTCSAFIIEA